MVVGTTNEQLQPMSSEHNVSFLCVEVLKCTLSLSLSQSLHNLGLTHVLHVYLRGGGMEDQQCTGEMAEYQYEAAWRCSMWENMEAR